MQDEDHGGTKVCFLDEVVGGQVVDPETRRDVERFRKGERARLLALRRARSVDEAKADATAIGAGLDRLLPDLTGKVVSGYWPIRGEPDLRGWMTAAHARGALIALPVVVEKSAPLEFRRWTPGDRMERGIWDIPVPVAGESVLPDVILAPVLGVDRAGYRLGNGGGYYDMTLAVLPVRPRLIGVGAGFARIETIFPLPWDIPMDEVVLAP